MAADAPSSNVRLGPKPGPGGSLARRLETLGWVGWLIPLSVLLAIALGQAMQWVPAYGGYTWIFPIWALRSVALRDYMPTIAIAAWCLGCWTVPERRADLGGFWRWLLAREGPESRWQRWAGVALVGGLAALAARAVSPYFRPVDLFSVALAVVWLAHRRPGRGQIRAAAIDALRVVVLLAAVSYVFTTVKSCLFVLRQPADQAILGFESAVFGEPPHRWITSATRAWPWLATAFEETYYRLFDHMAVGSIFLLGAGRDRDRERLWIALAVCYALGGFAYYLLPGLGPCYSEPALFPYLAEHAPRIHGTQRALLENSEAMRGTRPFQLPTYAFVACMPSLHMAHEFALLYYARASRPFFVLTAFFVALTWIATLGLGWHYAVDALGGLVLAAVAVLAAERYGPWLLPAVGRQAGARGFRPLTTSGWALGALCAAVVLAHGPTLFSSYVLDDPHLVLSARLRELADLTVIVDPGIYQISGEPRLAAAFRPVAGLASWITWQLFRDYPPSQHLVSLALTGGGVHLLYRWLRGLGVSLGVALVFAVLVAIHPLTSELTAYPSARDLLLGWALWLGILLPALQGRWRRAEWSAVAAATLLASLAHESFLLIGIGAVALPIGGAETGARVRWRRAAMVGHLIGLGAALAVRGLGDRQAWAVGEPLGTLGQATWRAAGALLSPVGLSPLVTAAPASRALGAGLVLVFGVALALAWRLGRRASLARLVAPGIVVTAAVLLGQAYGGSVAGVFADRGAFGVLIALLLAAAPFADRVLLAAAGRLDAVRRRVLGAGGVALGLAVLPFTWSGGMTYRDDRALARLLLAASPEDPASRARAGLMLAYEGDVDAAEEHCTAALGSPAVGSDAELCLAVVAARRGHDDEALARIGRFLERMPARTQARQLLWYLLTKQQRRDEIRAWVRRLAPRVGLQPDMARALDYAEKTRRAVNPLLLPPKE